MKTPKSGQREYNYKHSLKIWDELYMAFIGLFMLGASTAMQALPIILGNPDMRLSAAWPWYLFMSGFGYVGLLFLVKGILAMVRPRREKILLTPDEVIWISCIGRVKVRCNYNQIVAAREVTTLKPYVFGRRTIVRTNVGTIRFEGCISNYVQLRDFFFDIAAEKSEGKVFHYRSTGGIIIPLAFLIPLTVVECVLIYSLISLGTGRELFAPGIALPLSILFSPWFYIMGRLALSNLNEKIVLVGDRIRWFGPSGRLKTDFAASDVIKGSLESIPGRNGFAHMLKTKKGVLKWSDSICNAEELLKRMEDIAN